MSTTWVIFLTGPEPGVDKRLGANRRKRDRLHVRPAADGKEIEADRVVETMRFHGVG